MNIHAILQQPKWDHYNSLERKAAILHYGLVKNHAFHNGNKRIAVVCLITFLFINDVRLTASDDEVFEFTKMIAKSDPKEHDTMIDRGESWIEKHCQ